MEDGLDRRRFLRGAGLGAAAGAALLAGCGRPPTAEERGEVAAAADTKARGREWWTAPSKAPGQHTLMPLPYATDALVIKDPGNEKVKGISAQVVEWHHDKHHAGYVKALNGIEQDIAQLTKVEASANYSDFAEHKRRETFNASGMVLHDLYWQNMTPGGKTSSAGMGVVRKLVADFGSLDRWQEEFIATANTPNAGWAIVALAPYDRKLHNYACAFHDLGGVWGTVPLVALDVWEHAYYFDYGPDRGNYIQSFLRLMNWPAIEERFHTAARSL